MQFLFQPLAWGFLLVLVPLLIHLINLVRHRRTAWAAMEFLLESYRKNRKWVWLKQALLIASRMLAMALMVAMLAQWVSGSKWLSLLGRSTIHHYVVLDDSASMGDTANGKSAYQTALGAVASIASAAKQDSQSHVLSLFRASRASIAASRLNATNDESNTSPKSTTAADGSPQAAPDAASTQTASTATTGQKLRADTIADLLARTIPSDPLELLTKINGTTPTQLECSLTDALETISPLVQADENERVIVYLMSDFRSKDWTNMVALKQRLQSIKGDRVEIKLIDCVESQHENLTILSMEPRQEVLAAGVPTMINVTVKNNGVTPARNVATRITAVDYSQRDGEPKPTERFSGMTTELPPLVFDRIEPGESVTRNVQVVFPKSGSHLVAAELPTDSLQSDNTARCVLDMVDGVRVLLVDGDPGGKHSFFFESALNPGGTAKTGLIISREGPEYLRDTDSEALNNYACIILQSIPNLDARALNNLHRYVSKGGGLSLWFGDDVSAADYLRNYAAWTKPIPGASNTTPLLPFGLKGATELSKEAGDTTPDIIADNHPIFAPLLGLSNSPFQFVRIQRFVEIDTNSNATTASLQKSWKPVASLRNQQPLWVDYPIGAGRVLISLTSLDRRWSNWPQDPTFVVAALKMVGYLSSFRSPETSKFAGSPLRWDFSAQEMLPETQLLFPPASIRGVRSTLQVNATSVGDNSLRASLDPRDSNLSEDVTRSLTSAGAFEWWGTSTQGDTLVKTLARNTPPSEGEMEKIPPADLIRNLAGVKHDYRTASSIGSNLLTSSLTNRNMLLMAFLVFLLLAEQWLAWSASYHLPKR
ncbi:MAG: hypothetical protein FJ308_13985 [Planctomycetes bacterium]|nr:hypothetical protein [Planctomycetota bacterium]